MQEELWAMETKMALKDSCHEPNYYFSFLFLAPLRSLRSFRSHISDLRISTQMPPGCSFLCLCILFVLESLLRQKNTIKRRRRPTRYVSCALINNFIKPKRNKFMIWKFRALERSLNWPQYALHEAVGRATEPPEGDWSKYGLQSEQQLNENSEQWMT